MNVLVVGSAAYNLLMICALCISSINAPETRRIKLYSVFMVNAIFFITVPDENLCRSHHFLVSLPTYGCSSFYQLYQKM
jgi:hypothetical protein